MISTPIYSSLGHIEDIQVTLIMIIRGRHGRDRMVVGFTTTYAFSVYHH